MKNIELPERLLFEWNSSTLYELLESAIYNQQAFKNELTRMYSIEEKSELGKLVLLLIEGKQK